MVNEPFSIAHALHNLSENERMKAEYHLQELQWCLGQISYYTLRDDSRLAFRYATGELSRSPWDVSHEMATTQYLCENAPYQAFLPVALRRLASTMKKTFGNDWTTTWNAVADIGPEIVKLYMMEQTGMQYPDFLACSEPPGPPPIPRRTDIEAP